MPKIKAAFRKFDSPGKPYLPQLTIVVCVRAKRESPLSAAANNLTSRESATILVSTQPVLQMQMTKETRNLAWSSIVV
jgi:hypothetical protein